MPVILADRDADDWMDPRTPDPHALKRLLVPAPSDLMIATPVSPDVNSVDNDSPDLLQPAGQMSLSLRSGRRSARAARVSPATFLSITISKRE